MVEVGHKVPTQRVATAQAELKVMPETLATIRAGAVPKGDVEAVCRVAGLMAAKKTSELIPLCHPLALSGAGIDFELLEPDRVRLTSRVKCTGPTGVEMEALTAASVAALTLYDMLKAIDKTMVIENVRLLTKTGGKTDLG